jgi:hypothetical protein
LKIIINLKLATYFKSKTLNLCIRTFFNQKNKFSLKEMPHNTSKETK